MVDYKLFINNGIDAFGTSGKTLSIEEQPRTISVDFLADAIYSQNELVPKRMVKEVLSTFGTVAARLMAEGLALQFQSDGDVLLRMYADAKIKGGNINLQRARELTGNPQLTEEEMVSRAGEIVRLAGVQLRAYAEVQQKFNELLQSFKPQPNLSGTVERARIERTNTDDQGGSEQEQEQQTGNLLTIQKTGSGTVNVTDQSNHQIDSGDDVQAGQTVRLSVTPSGSATPTATLDGQSVTLMEDEGQYVGTFQMPAQSATLVVNTGE